MLLSASVVGDEAASELLREVADRARDLSGAWDRVLPQLRSEERKLFATRGHGHWPPNRASTVAKKGRNTPLVDSGRLLRALTTSRARGSVSRQTRTSLLFGVNDSTIFYSRFVGAERPFVLSERTARRIGEKAVAEWIGGAR